MQRQKWPELTLITKNCLEQYDQKENVYNWQPPTNAEIAHTFHEGADSVATGSQLLLLLLLLLLMMIVMMWWRRRQYRKGIGP